LFEFLKKSIKRLLLLRYSRNDKRFLLTQKDFYRSIGATAHLGKT
jgi:hypothetical protein